MLKGTLFASLVLSMAATTTKEKKRKEEAYLWKAGTSSGHITNLKQSILDFRYLWVNHYFVLSHLINKELFLSLF